MSQRGMWSCLLVGLLIGAIALFFGAAADEAPQYGGTLRCALASEPGTLDMHVTTGVNESMPAAHIFEGLFDFDENYVPQPFLLESWELTDQGKVATFHLRHGVLFHNGKEMKAADVIASLRRWGEYGLTAKALWSLVTELTALDDYTVRMVLSTPFGPISFYLANIYGGPHIYPEEIAAVAGAKPIGAKDYIGTGPYRFVEWKSGDYILLERFDGYASPTGEPSGFAGERVAYFDKLQFFMVPEDNARLVGVQAGTYDYVVNIPNDLLVTVEGDPHIVPILVDHPPIYPMALVNNKQGITTNVKLKQAILAALDMEPIMSAGYGDPKFWSLNGSYFAPGISWYTTAGTEAYNQADPGRARQLAAEAGYKGEPIRIIAAADMTAQYNQGVAVMDQLLKAGFNVSLEVFDKATFFARRNDRENPQWELALSFYSTTPDPSMVLMLSPMYAGWWDTPEIQVLREQLNQITDFTQRYAKWEEIMRLWYEQVPAIKFGDAFQLHLMRAEIGGGYGTEHPDMLIPYFWNAWKK